MKLCKDCGIKLFSNAPLRCLNCKAELRRKVQKENKTKYRYHKQPKARYKVYKAGAERRGLVFNLNQDEFLSFWNKPCRYCGEIVDTIGLDRKNNKEGYTISNTVSCCKQCNFMKHTMTEKMFIDKCVKIASVSLLQQVD